MTTIFISYRRDDSAGHSGRLYDHLCKAFGADEVFMDVDGIDLGANYKAVLREVVGRCDVMLVVIGQDWLMCQDSQGRRRLDDPNDWVRIETAEALARGIPVIPALVQGSALPASESLPEPLAALADRQAAVLDDRQWASAVADLVKRVKSIPRRKAQEQVQRWLAQQGLARLAAFGLAVAAAATAALVHFWPSDVEMPSLAGKTLAAAREAVEAKGLVLRTDLISHEESKEPEGRVIRQEPPAGLRVSRGQPVRLAVAAAQPGVDISGRIEIRDIGTEGIIGAAAAVMAMEAAQAGDGSRVKLSERYLFQKAKRHDESDADGTWMTAIVYVGEQFGVAPYAQWPYVPGEKRSVSAKQWSLLDAAAQDHRSHFHRVGDAEAAYRELRKGRPVLVLLHMGGPEWSHEDAMGGGDILASRITPQSREGRGAVVLVGFDPKQQRFKFANSWGTQWGQKGFGNISVEALNALADWNGAWSVMPAGR